MNRLIPIPVIESFPATLRTSEEMQDLATFLDGEFARWLDDAIGLERLKDPARAPAVALNAFGEWLSAGIKDRDDDRTKRAKIAGALDNSKYLSTWVFSAKPMIDAHVGGNARIVSGIAGDDSILCGSTLDPVGYFWFCLGGLDASAEYGVRLVGGAGIVTYTSDVIQKQADQMLLCGIDCPPDQFSFGLGGLDVSADYGARMLGDGTEFDTVTTDYVEPMIKGTILVDVDSSSLSAQDLEALKSDLKDIAPAYFKVYLGFTVGDTFIPYSNGLVG